MDSRDLEERLEELQEAEELSSVEKEEKEAIEKLKEECESFGWEDGIHFIKDYEFHEHAKELAFDCGFVNDKYNPLLNHIDWDSWAESVEMDYQIIDFMGDTYLWREA